MRQGEVCGAMSTIRVILAEDHALMRDAIKLVFDGVEDFELVGEVANGHDLLPLMRHVEADFVLLDVQLPGADGLECLAALAKHHPAAIVVAVPVSSEEACALLGEDADECICVETPTPFHGVGMWYYDFAQTTDEEVVTLLRRAAAELRQPARLGSMAHR